MELDKVGFVAIDRVEVVQMIANLKTSLRALVSCTKQRNSTLEKYSASATANGLTEGQFRYFIPMLVSVSEALATKQNYALFFSRHLADVLKDYVERKFPKVKFTMVKFQDENLEKLMPQRDLIMNYYPVSPEKK